MSSAVFARLRKEPVVLAAETSLVIALFFLSGASSLVYEVLWVKMFTQVFGNTTYAVSTVLTAFMAGLALGSYLFGRIVDRLEKWALLLYGILEAIIGAYALSVPLLISVITSFHAWAYRTYQPSSPLFLGLRFIISLAILIVPTTMMGATLPVIARFVVRRRETMGSGVGILYGVNTAGAVTGCYLAGFVLIGSAGITRTLHLAVAANALIAVAAGAAGAYVGIVRKIAPSAETPSTLSAFAGETGKSEEFWKRRIVLMSFALAGFASLCYEVMWTRVLVFFLGNSTYAFTSMLTTFLLGIALGSLVFARAADRSRDRFLLFGAIEIIIGLWALLSIPLFIRVFYLLEQEWTGFNIDLAWGSVTGLKFLKAFTVMFVPTLLMGAAFPVVCRIWSRDIRSAGKDVASVYSLNTIGAIAGSAFAGFVLIPAIGVQKGIAAVAFINLAIGVTALFLSDLAAARKRALIAVSAGVAALAVLLIPTDTVLRRPLEKWKNLLFCREDSMALVKVYETFEGDKNISINGYVVAGTNRPNQEIQKMLAHVPMLLHEGPRTALIVGFGAGGTSWSMSLYEPDRIDCIEFVPSVLKAAPYLNEANHGVLSNPRFHAKLDDGRTFLLATDRKFDVVSVDAIDPKHSGSGSLYSVDFFQLCKKRLNPRGVMVEWLPYHLLTRDEVLIILASFSEAFEYPTLWFTRYFNYLLLVGSDHKIEIDYQQLSRRMSDPKVAADLRKLEIYEPAEFIYCFAADTEAFREMGADARGLNTYDNPLIEFYSYPKWERFADLPFSERRGMIAVNNLGDTPEEADRNRRSLMAHLDVADYLIRAKGFDRDSEKLKRLRFYKAALSLDPSDAAASMLASYTERGLKKDLNMLIAAAEKKPTPQAYCDLAEFYFKQGDLHSAADVLENALVLDPSSDAVRLNLANIYERIGGGNRGTLLRGGPAGAATAGPAPAAQK